MQFLYQPLTWGFLLVTVPILIHLINLLRHRKQKWAAMDFLLESYRRNRRWVMLKQWLLLAARMLAMMLLVAMLAKWISSSRWLGTLGGQATHHYLLLDDSYSMAASDADDTAYASALRAVNALVRSIAAQPGQNQLTLLRLSQGKSPFVGDMQHLSHRIAARGLSKRHTVTVIHIATASTAITGVFLARLEPWQAVLAGEIGMLPCV